MAQVVLKDLNKKYDEVHAVKDVNLTIRDKEFMVFVGPSGCGKTTTLRMVAGLEEITSGEISIGDRVVNDLPPKDRDIAMVFQNYALYPHMERVRQHGLRPEDAEVPEGRDRQAGAGRRRDPGHRGAAQAQARGSSRAASGSAWRSGRAIVRHPQVFLFDEPLSNLDAKLRVQMRVELKRLHERLETTAIYVTHDQVEAMTLGSRVVVMKDGWVQQVGEPLDIYDRPANKFVAGFIGSPAMNFLPVTVSETSGSIFLETNGLRTKVPASKAAALQAYKGQAVTLGIRPEDLRVGSGADSADLAFDAVVEVVEPLGSEILLNVSVGGQSVVCRVEPSVKAKPHEKIRMAFVPERIHFFEAKTEAVIK